MLPDDTTPEGSVLGVGPDWVFGRASIASDERTGARFTGVVALDGEFTKARRTELASGERGAARSVDPPGHCPGGSLNVLGLRSRRVSGYCNCTLTT